MINLKHRILLAFFAIALISNAMAADLSTNIMRRVNTANLALDQADDMISRSRATSAQSSVNKAQIEYKNIMLLLGLKHSSFERLYRAEFGHFFACSLRQVQLLVG